MIEIVAKPMPSLQAEEANECVSNVFRESASVVTFFEGVRVLDQIATGIQDSFE